MSSLSSSQGVRTVSLYGATGTIGDNTLSILRNNRDKFKLKVVTAGSNAKKLSQICREFEPEVAAILDESKYDFLKSELAGLKTKLLAGKSSLLDVAEQKSDVAIIGISGMAGLEPTVRLIENTEVIAIANKESIVCGGKFLQEKIRQHKKTLVPVDSEHSALFQTLEPNAMNEMKSIVITASGGPFLNHSMAELEHVKISQALNHPRWKMGQKNSIDSATMVNKGLEMVEAYYLFPVAIDQIKVVIHPESIVHCFVNFIDGTSKALLSNNDMTKSISYALNYPSRLQMNTEFNITDYKSLNFEAVDKERFKVIDLVYDMLRVGGSAPIIFNTANEMMVEYYLSGKIKFTDIVNNIIRIMETAKIEVVENIEHVYEIDKYTRHVVTKLCQLN